MKYGVVENAARIPDAGEAKLVVCPLRVASLIAQLHSKI
jgi:hypothetical protein